MITTGLTRTTHDACPCTVPGTQFAALSSPPVPHQGAIHRPPATTGNQVDRPPSHGPALSSLLRHRRPKMNLTFFWGGEVAWVCPGPHALLPTGVGGDRSGPHPAPQGIGGVDRGNGQCALGRGGSDGAVPHNAPLPPVPAPAADPRGWGRTPSPTGLPVPPPPVDHPRAARGTPDPLVAGGISRSITKSSSPARSRTLLALPARKCAQFQ